MLKDEKSRGYHVSTEMHLQKRDWIRKMPPRDEKWGHTQKSVDSKFCVEMVRMRQIEMNDGETVKEAEGVWEHQCTKILAQRSVDTIERVVSNRSRNLADNLQIICQSSSSDMTGYSISCSTENIDQK